MRPSARLPVVLRGYDRDQVDGLLKRISQALNGGPPMDADEIRVTRFDVVLRGYEPRAVDELVRECIRELEARGPIADRPARPRANPSWLINWIQNARFSGAGMRSGYDVRDVDAFLDRVIAGLRGAAPPVSARDIRESTFRVVRLGPGYDEQEVDRFLVQLASALEGR
ncbi:DivIVA domain-containing protein [Actinomadura decatromicini]|uniref:DivIVA domain-containing protein n=1 Tax=Actinomadura decatromicini TaxID=2604572 RepID=A0A5D3FJV7_9ACTN|nr:DivIVA domain-containing protein [Actinomadura decatromicini]TYK48308.1 DivIVA domain-containing protein [Actinomadura decatromicini]